MEIDLKKYGTNNAEPPFDLDEDDFISINELVGKTIDIFAVKLFENDLGPGVFIGFSLEESIEGKQYHYTTTHSMNIVKIFTPELAELLSEPMKNTMEVTVSKRASKKDPRKTVLELI